MSDTLQEYLVGLGFKIDEAGLNKFNLFLAKSTTAFGALGTASINTAVQIGESVTRVARQFENLYYASQRTGETVAGLQAVGFAAKQIGLSSEQARGAIEGFTRAIRTNPGMEGLLKGLGVGPGSPMERLQQFIENTKGLPYYIRAQYAGLLGMEEQTFRMLTLEGGMDRYVEEQKEYSRRQREAGVDADDLGKKSTDLGRSLNRLQSTFEILGQKIASHFIEPLTKAVQKTDELTQVVSKSESLGQKNRGFSHWGLMTGLGIANYLGLVSDDEMTQLRRADPDNPNTLGKGFVQRHSRPGGAPGRTNAAGVMRYFEAKGYSPAAAAAMAANASQETEGTFDPESFTAKGGGIGAYGLFQWRAKRQRELRARYGMHPTAEQQMDFADWELHNTEAASGRMLMMPGAGAYALGSGFSAGYERHGNASEDAARGRLAEKLVVQPVQNITVTGASDPHRTADLIAEKTRQQNADLVRNLQGAVR